MIPHAQQEDMQRVQKAAPNTRCALENRTRLQVYETLGDRKLHLLFELWDKDGDGLISFVELALGLRKFSTASEPVTETAADAAEVRSSCLVRPSRT